MFFGGNFYDSSYPVFIFVRRKVLLENNTWFFHGRAQVLTTMEVFSC